METLPDIGGLLESLERAGGYAALLAIIVLGLFWLATRQISEQARRSQAREEIARQQHQATLERERRSHEAALERERQNAARYEFTTERMMASFDQGREILTGVLETNRSLVETARPLVDTLHRIDEHIAMLEAERKGGKQS